MHSGQIEKTYLNQLVNGNTLLSPGARTLGSLRPRSKTERSSQASTPDLVRPALDSERSADAEPFKPLSQSGYLGGASWPTSSPRANSSLPIDSLKPGTVATGLPSIPKRNSLGGTGMSRTLGLPPRGITTSLPGRATVINSEVGALGGQPLVPPLLGTAPAKILFTHTVS